MSSLTRALVERIVALRERPLDGAVRQVARRLLLDHLGVAAAGAARDSARAVRETLRELGSDGGPGGTASDAPLSSRVEDRNR